MITRANNFHSKHAPKIRIISISHENRNPYKKPPTEENNNDNNNNKTEIFWNRIYTFTHKNTHMVVGTLFFFLLVMIQLDRTTWCQFDHANLILIIFWNYTTKSLNRCERNASTGKQRPFSHRSTFHHLWQTILLLRDLHASIVSFLNKHSPLGNESNGNSHRKWPTEKRKQMQKTATHMLLL